ncbi:MAG: DUF1501 domain-containing protein [Gammaproteobacteria bacterium]|nr:DUF1501 domain-containing protein [Gammaproteobacteria bacterium]
MAKLEMTRREFLKLTGASLFLSAAPVSGFTKDLPQGNISVILLQGGMDGLTAVPPIGDPALASLRQEIGLSNPIKVNPFFGLHPKLQHFSKLMARGDASIVHATSFPYTKRSHFEGQNYMQGGGSSPFSTTTGWLGRALDLALLPGRAMSLELPLILRGSLNVDNFYPARVNGSSKPEKWLIEQITMAHQAEEARAFKAVGDKVADQARSNIPRDPVSLAKYAGEQMSKKGGPVASVIRVNQFDTHALQGADEGSHGDRLELLDEVIKAYREGLGDAWDKSIILTLTEFGRTASVNGTAGTDHGYASAGLLAGGLINKSRVISEWPGLADADLYEERDLYATIDYRSVCAACIERVLGLDHDLISQKVFLTSKLKRTYDYIFS